MGIFAKISHEGTIQNFVDIITSHAATFGIFVGASIGGCVLISFDPLVDWIMSFRAGGLVKEDVVADTRVGVLQLIIIVVILMKQRCFCLRRVGWMVRMLKIIRNTIILCFSFDHPIVCSTFVSSIA